MIITAHQPVYLPWLGLFHKIALADVFCFFEDVQYQAKDWNNRNRIKFSNGKADWLSVPVLRKGFRERSYMGMRINNETPWRHKHWLSLETNYVKAAHFNRYRDELKMIYDRQWDYLVDLNYEMLLLFLRWLKIPTKIVRMRDYEFKGEKSDLVLDMCCQLGAELYIFGEQGKDYANIPAFRSKNVIPYFQNYQHPKYPQLHGDFVSHLSVLDLFFNCGDGSYSIIMSGNISRNELEAWAAGERHLLDTDIKHGGIV